jgi:hypothetical protein
MLGKKISKTVTFMGEEVEIKKLSVSEVLTLQKSANELQKDANDADGLKLIVSIITTGVTEAAGMKFEDFKEFPMEELSRLSNEVMVWSGMSAEGK